MYTWLKTLQKKFKRNSTKRIKRRVVVGATPGVPLSMPRSYDQLAQEGYCQNVIVYRAVTLIARNLASVPWLLTEGDRRLDHHPLLALMQQPNASQTGVSFLEALTSHLLLAGNAYVELSATEKNALACHILRPDRVQVVPQEGETQYLYTVGDKRRVIQKSPKSKLSPLLHLKMFHPLNDWYGMSALEAAAASIDQHNEVGHHNLALMQNGGRPSGALILKKDDLSEEELQTLREDVQTVFQGTDNAGRIVFLEGDMKWEEMGVSPKDLDFVSGKYLSAREIAQAFGVPAMLVGVPGDATFANYREARLHLWEDTILPLLDKIISQMNQWLCPLYGHTFRFSYDLENIPALVVRRESLWARMEACSFLTNDEKRQALGYGAAGGKA
jgi:HK97 family phage portal protein